jgi:hypothetical protein
VLLFIGADIVILWLWSKSGKMIGVGRSSPL